jgi:hypothetical protein
MFSDSLHETLDIYRQRESELWLRLQKETAEERRETYIQLEEIVEAKNHLVDLLIELGAIGPEDCECPF